MRMTRKLVGVGMMAVLTGLSGCSTLSSLNPFASKPKGNLPAPLVELKGTMAVRTAWKLDIGKSQDYMFSPAQAGNTVVVAAADGAIARVEAATGKVLWRIKADSKLTAGVGTDGNFIVVGGDKGMLLCFDMTGKLLWKVQLSSEILSSPVVADGIVVARSIDNRIVAYDAATADKKWTVQRTAPSLTLRIAPGLVVAGKDVIVAQPAGKVASLIMANGAPRWEIEVGVAKGATELERVTDIGGTPVVFESDVCAATYQGRAADDKGTLTAFNRDGGASAWKNDKLSYRRLSTPISYGRFVAVSDYQGYIHFLSREDGTFLARMATDGSAVTSTPLVAGSNLIFQTQNGTVTAVAVE
jgi:outer membrane protein assembly factor BamB